MKCPNHLTRDIAGYCCQCGSFFCEDCLTRHGGDLYCPKHYKPIAAKLDQEHRLSEGRKRHARHALIVEFKSGKRAQGICRTMNIREPSFHLEGEDDDGIATEEIQRIRFEELKCVRHVKSYTGKFEHSAADRAFAPNGDEVIVEFRDGEKLIGTTMSPYNPDAPRYYVVPKDPASNDINVLVETASVARIFSPEEYAAHLKLAKEEKVAEIKVERKQDAKVELGQDETMGDFYFEQHNYKSATEQYQLAFRAHPSAGRIRRKLVVSIINVGIGFIKSREYPKALEYMDRALEIDPENPHAKKKSKQLRRVIEKTQRRMKAYLDGNLAQRGDAEDQ